MWPAVALGVLAPDILVFRGEALRVLGRAGKKSRVWSDRVSDLDARPYCSAAGKSY